MDYEAIVAKPKKKPTSSSGTAQQRHPSLLRQQLNIVVVDPIVRCEISYYPGETNVHMADVIVINKIDSADLDDINEVRANVRMINPKAQIIDAASPLSVDKPELITDKRVLVVEDGPTLTHGEMTYGAGVIAAEKYGCAELGDPREWAVGEIAETFGSIPISVLLPHGIAINRSKT